MKRFTNVLTLLRRFAAVLIQVMLAVVGFAGAYFHAFPTKALEEHQNLPVLDITTIAWIGVVVVAFVFPRITEVGFGELSVKLGEATKSSEDFRDVTNALANLTQNWSKSALLLVDLLKECNDAGERDVLCENYARDRMGEARPFLGDSSDSVVRIAIWIYDPNEETIRFKYSPNFVPTQKEYKPGEGFLGQAFLERRTFSEADVRVIPSYKQTRDGDPPYRGVICVPLDVGGGTIGMLTIDKGEATDFNLVSDEIARGLAAQCSYAISVRQLFPNAADEQGA